LSNLLCFLQKSEDDLNDSHLHFEVANCIASPGQKSLGRASHLYVKSKDGIVSVYCRIPCLMDYLVEPLNLWPERFESEPPGRR
jgi:hypothetical protein